MQALPLAYTWLEYLLSHSHHGDISVSACLCLHDEQCLVFVHLSHHKQPVNSFYTTITTYILYSHSYTDDLIMIQAHHSNLKFLTTCQNILCINFVQNFMASNEELLLIHRFCYIYSGKNYIQFCLFYRTITYIIQVKFIERSRIDYVLLWLQNSNIFWT